MLSGFTCCLIMGAINRDATKISWDHAQRVGIEKGRIGKFEKNNILQSIYRPFAKSWLYYDRFFNNRVYQMPSIFPDVEARNLVIMLNSNWSGHGNIALMSGKLPDLHSNGDAQCFPLKLYEKIDNNADGELFAAQETENGYKIKDGITDSGLEHFRAAYPNETITKEDIFYYIYGLLHSEDYRARYAYNLSKQLPRIPCVKKGG